MVQKKKVRSRAMRSVKIDDLKAWFEANQGGVVTDYRGLDVAAITDLRAKFREQGISYHVVKNTLTRIAVAGTGYESLNAILSGPTAIAFSPDDAIAAAKAAVDFAKEHKVFEVKGGFMDGQVLSANEVDELSKLGGKEQLLVQLLSVINAPAQKFLGAINGVPQKFLGVLLARADQLEEGA